MKTNQVSKKKPNAQSTGFGLLILGSVMAVIIGAVLLYVGLFTTSVLSTDFDSTLSPTAASGTVVFSGNVTNGTAVNLTDPTGFKYVFEFNLSGRGSNSADTCDVYASEPGCIPVNASFAFGRNSSWLASGNLTLAINNNATVAANVTATNTTNTTTITAKSTGVLYNNMALSDNSANITVTGLSGGVEGTTAWATAKNNTNTAFTLLGIILILGGVGGLLSAIFGLAGHSKR